MPVNGAVEMALYLTALRMHHEPDLKVVFRRGDERGDVGGELRADDISEQGAVLRAHAVNELRHVLSLRLRRAADPFKPCYAAGEHGKMIAD